jgi:hypothetical protein
MVPVLSKLKQIKTNESWVIFGTGNHTPRFLPQPGEAGLPNRIRVHGGRQQSESQR